MTVVAVAGGTGGVGKTVVEVLRENPRFQVLVLSRNNNNNRNENEQVTQLAVNYADVQSLTNTLVAHRVHTVICAIGMVSDATSQAQLNLIEAAERSTCTSRFLPSEYSYIQTEKHLPIDPGIPWFTTAASRLARSPTLKYTRIIPGFFMDYWGMPHVKTHLQPFTFGVDMRSCSAAIPGSGAETICMTYSYDMARFVARLLLSDDWDEFSVLCGGEVSYNRLVELGEEVRGQKFHVVYDSIDKVNAGHVTVPPQPDAVDDEYSPEEVRDVTVLVSRLTVAGVFDLPKENRLNERFPDIRPMTVEEFVRKAWSGR